VKYAVLRACAWLIPSAAILMSVVPPALRPVTGLSHLFEHMFWFLACGIVFGAQWPKARFHIYIAGVAFCAVLELVQFWVPGRHARLSDFLVDACATVAGISLARILHSIRSAMRPALSE
jgi:VanZ family protein